MLPTEADIISLPADPFEMGLLHGTECKFSIRLLCYIYVQRVICRNDDELEAKYCSRAEKLFTGIDSRWSEELKGLSQGSGVDEKILKLGNSFLDLGLYKAGCRQVCAIDYKESRLLHAHNMDWDNLGGVGNLMVTVFRTEAGEGRLATVHVAFPAMVGALTVINEKGISLGFNQTGISRGNCAGMPVFMKLRDIAERCSSFEDAENEILNMKEGMPFSIMLADALSLKAAVYERRRDSKIRKRIPDDGIVTSDNVPWYGADLARCPVDVEAHNADIFSGNGGVKSPVEKIKSVLRNRNVLLSCNIYSVIFDYKNNVFYLASGNIPAVAGKYIKHQLF
jgi:hypothetical protein